MDKNVQEGWIKLWRKVFESSVFDSEDHTLFKTFIYCLGRANHKENKIFMDGKEMILKPGQFITGRDEASKDLHFKGKMWDRKVDSLRKLQILTKQVTNRFTIISIINWDIYQGSYNDDDQLSDQPMTSRRPANDQPMTTDKNVKNVKNVKKYILPDVKTFIDFYYNSFKEKFNTPPMIQGGKDGLTIKRLLKNNPLEELKELLLKMFESNDPFIIKSGYTLGVFQSQINKLKIGDIKYSGLKQWAEEIREEENETGR